MIDKKINKLNKLEAIRGFAAVYVVIHHCFYHINIFGYDLSFLLSFGQESVILFFILSGFVIEYSFSKSKDLSFNTYFKKRFFRIYIPLLIVFVINYIFLYLSNSFIDNSWTVFVGNIFMLQDISALKPNVIVQPFLGNSPLWSLSYEWWFYMMFFPLTIYLKEKATYLVYLLSFFGAITYVIYPNFVNRELMYLLIWWCGVIMAKAYSKNHKIVLKDLKQFIGVNIVIIFILIFNVYVHFIGNKLGVYPYLELRHFIFTIAAILAALCWQKLNWFWFNYTIGLFEKVAPISFALYITHYFMIKKATYLDQLVDNDTIKILIYIFNCVLVSYLIERVMYVKINQWIKKLIN